CPTNLKIAADKTQHYGLLSFFMIALKTMVPTTIKVRPYHFGAPNYKIAQCKVKLFTFFHETLYSYVSLATKNKSAPFYRPIYFKWLTSEFKIVVKN
ncbi:hypothetical protein, partial [Klebsiella pneumoniae]|uniref:hypothetical protein n=1 Tax=Klebsiella pneumoniae TaxID=573 RepID=UPI001C8F2807